MVKSGVPVGRPHRPGLQSSGVTARKLVLGVSLALLGLLVAVLAFAGSALLLTEPEVPEGVTVAGTQLSGLSEEAATTTVQGLADTVAATTLFLDPQAGPESLRSEISAPEAGIAVDVDATLASVRALLPSPLERLQAVLDRDAEDPAPVNLPLAVASTATPATPWPAPSRPTSPSSPARRRSTSTRPPVR